MGIEGNLYFQQKTRQITAKVELDRTLWLERRRQSLDLAGGERFPAQVEVYSGADEVELILNGQSLGRKPAGKENHNKALFELTYEPGTLEAISYTGGVEISRDQVTTAGTPAALRIVLEKTQIAANGEPCIRYCGDRG